VKKRSFQELVLHHRVKHPVDSERILVALDPGETTGYGIFKGSDLIEYGQLATSKGDLAAVPVVTMIKRFRPSAIVYETYRVYQWKTEDHAWNDMHTSQLIGAIRFIATFQDLPILLAGQTAQVAKQFCTDTKLEDWGFWIKGQRHARDAIRHGCWYILFNEVKTLIAHQLKQSGGSNADEPITDNLERDHEALPETGE
jgi:hypothetical protein